MQNTASHFLFEFYYFLPTGHSAAM